MSVEHRVEFSQDGDLVLTAGLYRLVFHDGGQDIARIETVAPVDAENMAVSISLDDRQLLELAVGIVSRLEHYDESLADVREILTGLFEEGMEF